MTRTYKQIDDPEFPHGTRRGYVYGCTMKKPCPATPTCWQVYRDGNHERAAARAAGRIPPSSMVPRRPVHEHLRRLIAGGCTVMQISVAAGFSNDLVRRIYQDGGGTCTQETSQTLLSVTVEDCQAAERMITRYQRHHRIAIEPLRAHVKNLLKVPHVTYNVIARCADVADTTVRSVVVEDRPTIRAATAQKIMSVTKREVVEALPMVPVTRRHIQLIRSMQVQGWSVEWQAEQINRSVSWLMKILAGEATQIKAVDARGLHDLAERIERWGRERYGGNWGPYTASAGKARALGWHPLAAYNDHGRLLKGAVLDDPKKEKEAAVRAQQETRAYNRLETLRLTIAFQLTSTEIAERLDRVHPDQVNRWRYAAGLRFLTQAERTTFEPGVPVQRSVLRPECRERAKAIMAIVGQVTNPLVDPVKLCQELDALIKKFNAEDKKAKKAEQTESATDRQSLATAA